MKTFLITQLVFAVVFGALFGSIAWPSDGLANLASFLLWLLIVASLLASCLMHGLISDAEKGEGPARQKGLQACRDMIERLDARGLPNRVLGWAESIAIVVAAAYAGRLWAAGFYVLAAALAMAAEFGARQALAKADKPMEA